MDQEQATPVVETTPKVPDQGKAKEQSWIKNAVGTAREKLMALRQRKPQLVTEGHTENRPLSPKKKRLLELKKQEDARYAAKRKRIWEYASQRIQEKQELDRKFK